VSPETTLEIYYKEQGGFGRRGDDQQQDTFLLVSFWH